MSRSRFFIWLFVVPVLFWGLGCSPENKAFQSSDTISESDSSTESSTEEDLTPPTDPVDSDKNSGDPEQPPSSSSGDNPEDSDPPPAPSNPPPTTTSPYDGACEDIDFQNQQLNEAAYEMCLSVNEEREKQGRSPLVIRQAISDAAWLHARDMHDRGYFSHYTPEGDSPYQRMRDAGISFRSGGENISAGRSTVSATMNGWMSSSGHRANILNSSYDAFGVGYFNGSNGYRHYWVQKFVRD